MRFHINLHKLSLKHLYHYFYSQNTAAVKMMAVRYLRSFLPKELNSLTQNYARTMSSTGSLVDVKVNDKTGVATVTMQRPPVNGLNLELIKALSNAIDDLSNNRSKGMILTSVSEIHIQLFHFKRILKCMHF